METEWPTGPPPDLENDVLGPFDHIWGGPRPPLPADFGGPPGPKLNIYIYIYVHKAPTVGNFQLRSCSTGLVLATF